MWKAFFARSWKGFVTRYLTILLVLLAINYMVKHINTSQPNQIEAENLTQSNMEVTHEVVGNDLHLDFDLADFQLSFENVGKEKVEGQGHIHLYIDGQKVMKIYESQYVWKNLETGKHHVRVELAHNDHEPYGVEEFFYVTIEE
jgi:hypothetical protein